MFTPSNPTPFPEADPRLRPESVQRGSEEPVFNGTSTIEVSFTTRRPLARRIIRIEFTSVVLPTPGPPGFSSQSQTVGRGGRCGRADLPSSEQERKGLDELHSQLTQSIESLNGSDGDVSRPARLNHGVWTQARRLESAPVVSVRAPQ